MRTNLAQAYTWLMQRYHPGDELYIFGFSRGAYTARALVGMLARPGLMRPGSENLVDYAIREYTTNLNVSDESQKRKTGIRDFADAFCWGTEQNPLFPGGWSNPEYHEDWHCVPVDYLGVWDTVKASGFLGFGTVTWPFTRELFNAKQIRHAVSIDEHRRPYHQYLVYPRDGVEEVWFCGVHSDVGGTFADNCDLARISLKWVADGVADRLYLRMGAYNRNCTMKLGFVTGRLHSMSPMWALVGRRSRVLPIGAAVHKTVGLRLTAKSSHYCPKLPREYELVDEEWLSSGSTHPLALPM
jgi:hypothetical protein